jgi:hypothetical protein
VEGKYGASKFISLSQDLGVTVSPVTSSAGPKARKGGIFGGPGAPGAMFSVGDANGTIDLKVSRGNCYHTNNIRPSTMWEYVM